MGRFRNLVSQSWDPGCTTFASGILKSECMSKAKRSLRIHSQLRQLWWWHSAAFFLLPTRPWLSFLLLNHPDRCGSRKLAGNHYLTLPTPSFSPNVTRNQELRMAFCAPQGLHSGTKAPGRPSWIFDPIPVTAGWVLLLPSSWWLGFHCLLSEPWKQKECWAAL